jgi:hypothetical protein
MGFARSGVTSWTWQEAMLSKYNQASNPALHRWLAQQLASSGYEQESRMEVQLADGLTKHK